MQVSVLQILFSLQKHLSTAFSTPSAPQFHNSHFRKIVYALLSCPSSSRKGSSVSNGSIDTDVLHLFHETWFSVHDDIRWFFLREAGSVTQNLDSSFTDFHLQFYTRKFSRTQPRFESSPDIRRLNHISQLNQQN